MNKPDPTSCRENGVEYSTAQQIAANLPYAAMILLGACILRLCTRNFASGALLSVLFLIYGIGGALWIIVFLCPHCKFHNSRSCPCGYGPIAGRLVRRVEGTSFKRKFLTHIPVIVPLWLIPPVAGVAAMMRDPSKSLAIVLALFVLDAFVLLPLVSRSHCCAQCPQMDDCPWMRKP